MLSDPSKNVPLIGLTQGMHVADLGAGAGYYAIAAARVVGSEGKVYAVEVQKELLSRVKSTMDHEHVSNVEVVWGDIEKKHGTRLRDKSMDAVLLVNTLFQLTDKEGCAREVKRILKEGGLLCVIDWKEAGGLGPPAGHVYNEEKARALFEKEGFTFDRTIAVGERQYGLVFRVHSQNRL